MKYIVAAVACFAVVVIALSWYLGPDDLARCGNAPGTSKKCYQADAIVAVSGGDTIARTKEAIKLYQHNWAPKLIFSGAAMDKSGPSNAEVMKQEALDEGVPADDIMIEENSETTKQNAEKTQNIFDANNIKRVILVTSAYHQRRAGLEFAQKSKNIEVRNHPVASDNQWSTVWWVTPIGWFLALGEFTKILVFYLGGSR